MYQILLILAVSSTAKSEMEGFIVGGNEVAIRFWPFITFIEAIMPDKKMTACGGSLLSSQTVLTAAHCLDDITAKKTLNVQYTIFMGHSSFQKSTMYRRVKGYETHDNYDPDCDDVHDDIGIMFLHSPVKFVHNVKKVLLVHRNFNDRLDKHLLVAGWGRYDTGADVRISPRLKDVKLTSISSTMCAEKSPFIEDITKVVCAAASHEYAYSGDSGGPMVTRNGRLQLGIVSFRNEETKITVFTSIPHYFTWINHTNLKLYKKYCGDDDWQL